MPRRLSPEKQLELDRLARILGVIAAWAAPLTGLPPEGETLTRAVSRAYEAGNLPGLRMVLNDLVPMTQAATLNQRKDLDRQLREKAGVGLSALMQRQSAQAARLIERGQLTSEQQYYLVREHVELLADDPDQAADVPRLHALLEAYEARAARRARR